RGRAHARGLGKVIEPFADSLDFPLVVLGAQLPGALLDACRAQRLLETFDGLQVGALSLGPIRIARYVVEPHLIGHLEAGVEVVERGFGADGAVDNQPAVVRSWPDVGVEGLQAAVLPADR